MDGPVDNIGLNELHAVIQEGPRSNEDERQYDERLLQTINKTLDDTTKRRTRP